MTATANLSPPKRLLLQKLLRGDGTSNSHGDEKVARRDRGSLPPLSAEQQHVWLHASMAPDQPLYNEAITIHRRGSFDLAILERSLNEILRRHEIWRTSFEAVDGKLLQIVHPELSLRLELVDLTHLPENAREEMALRIATADARKPFDLGQVPLLRAKVMKLAADMHRLYLTLHHIIFDGVSIYRVVMPELAALYESFSRGLNSPLAEPTLQYGDYALWREEHLESEAAARQLAYWRRQLSGDLPVLHLATNSPRGAAPSYRGGMETFRLPATLTAALKKLSLDEGTTLYVTLLAAFKTLLHRYSGQQDIIVGGVTDMRRRPELEGMIGYFLNSVALRTRPSTALTFRRYMGEVQDAVLGALDASTVPFDRIVRELQPKRDIGRHPLFQILFSIEPPAPDFGEGWDLTQMDVTIGTAKFDLYLELDERDHGVIGRFLYSTDLFDRPSIQRMIGHWIVLLEGAVANPDCALGALPLLTTDEVREHLAWNATERDYPATMVHEWFADKARRTPEAVAVECAGQRLSYRELDRRAEQLAARLRLEGVARETLVAIAIGRSPAMIVGLLAVLKAGGAYLPLDAALPRARLALLLDDARPAVLLTERALLAELPESDARIVLCDEPCEIDSSVSKEPLGDGDADRLAYVIYTSGSTGRPKAVEVSHRSLVNLLAAMQREPGFGADDSLLAVTTLSFDIAALELFLPLVSGGRLVIADHEEARDPGRLAARIGESRCTLMQATPAMWRGLLAAGWSGHSALKILCGGEALPRRLAAQLLSCGAGLWNMYGPTETTIWSFLHKVTEGDGPVPIGRPLANTTGYVLDAQGVPVPAGIAGELYIGGAGVARGYRKDAALTRERFVSTPAAPPGQRFYRTGDVVRCRSDGALEWLGRADNEVKIRGFRVGLEEIEAVILTHGDVASAAAKAWPDTSGEMSLVAYVVGKAASVPNFADLRQFLRRLVPEYMVPSRYVGLPAMPMTANGKVDRNRLPEPQQEARSLAAALDVPEPRDKVERDLAEIWKALLGRATIGINDSFFDVGGHSLLAFMLVAEIKKKMGRDLPPAALFHSPTIAALAKLLRSAAEPAFSHLVPLRRGGEGRPVFIVHGIFGDVLQFKELAERLRTDRPVYGLQARGVDARQEPHASIAEMTEAYIAAIRAVQPAGPYALGGYSFGGLIAFEMACRLREAGEEIELLALFDVDVHERNLSLPAWLLYKWSLANRVIRKMRVLPVRLYPAYLIEKAAMVWNRLSVRLGMREHGDPSNASTGPLPDHYRRMYQVGMREFVAFVPRRYDGRISVFHAMERGLDACDPLPVWRRVAAAIDIYPVAGEHSTMMVAHVDSVARALSRCLAALGTGRPPARRARAAEAREDISIGRWPTGNEAATHRG